MADVMPVSRSAASLLTSRLAVAGIALLFLGVSTRLLTMEQMAVFALYSTLCALLTPVCSLGLLTSCIKLLPGLLAKDDHAGAALLLRRAACVYVAGASVVTVALLLGAGLIGRLLLRSSDLSGDVRAACLAAFCFGLYEASQLLLSALQRFGRVGAYNVAAALTQRILSLGLFFVFGLRGYLAGFAIGSLAGAALGIATIIPLMRKNESSPAQSGASDQGATGTIIYSLPFYADGYLRYFYMQADQLLVALFLGPADLSLYFVAKRFIQYAQVLVSSLVDPLGTKAAQMRETDPSALERTFRISLRYFVLLFLPLSVLLASTSPFLLLLVGGERYTSASWALALLFLSVPFFAVFSHLWTFAYVLGRPADRLTINLVSSFSQAAAIIALMPFLHLAGLALARAVGFAVAMVFARGRLARNLPAAARRVELSAGLACLVPVTAMAALVIGPHLIIGRPLLIPIYAVPAVAVCAALYFMLVLTAQDRAEMARLVPGQGRASCSLRSALTRGAAADAGSHRI
jgi:O-antigen/teichoic acid export membrane protein